MLNAHNQKLVTFRNCNWKISGIGGRLVNKLARERQFPFDLDKCSKKPSKMLLAILHFSAIHFYDLFLVGASVITKKPYHSKNLFA